MNFIKYSAALIMNKGDKQAALASMREKEMRKVAELAISKLEMNIEESMLKLNELMTEYPLNFQHIISSMNHIDLQKREIKQYKKIIHGLFDDDSDSALSSCCSVHAGSKEECKD